MNNRYRAMFCLIAVGMLLCVPARAAETEAPAPIAIECQQAER